MRRNCIKFLCLYLLVVASVFAQTRPLIGITSVFESTETDTVGKIRTNMSYVNAVIEAGGTPVVLPTVRSERAILDYVAALDGLVLVGGADIPPRVYGEKTHSTVDSLSSKRFWFEGWLIDAWLATEKPVFGICLGCQFTNVMSGGTLIQDIPSKVNAGVIHRQKGGVTHEIKLERESLLYSILGQDILVVNSYHHQAVKKVGDNLSIVARAKDGVIEALEFTSDRFGLLVQWHPERMEFEHRNKLFRAFVTACQ